MLSLMRLIISPSLIDFIVHPPVGRVTIVIALNYSECEMHHTSNIIWPFAMERLAVIEQTNNERTGFPEKMPRVIFSVGRADCQHCQT
jgi:hypothetical protein